jgi:F-type H+-transporting ATPase subunit b
MLDLSLGLLINTAVTFIILLVLLNAVLYKPLLEFMAKREESIKRDLDNASKNTQEVASFHKEAESIISKAKAEAVEMKTKALDEIKSEVSTQIEAKKSELDTKYASFLEGLSEERVSLKNQLLSQMPLFKDGLKIKLSQL